MCVPSSPRTKRSGMASLSSLTQDRTDEGGSMKDVMRLSSSLADAPPFDDIVFVNPHWTEGDALALDDRLPTLGQANFIAIVSSFRLHVWDKSAPNPERNVLSP